MSQTAVHPQTSGVYNIQKEYSKGIPEPVMILSKHMDYDYIGTN